MAEIIAKAPSECSQDEIDRFEDLVKKGGEVASEGLRNRIMQAEQLVFLIENDKTLSGVAALKKPNSNYRKRVFTKAASQEDPNEFIFEAGWIYVEEHFRGRKYSHSLLDTILKLANGKFVYATTREMNEAMLRTNLHSGLKQSGKPYESEEGDYKLVLFLYKISS